MLAAVEAAGRAPSSHNTQPWRFAIGASHIDVLADRTRALPVNDPHDRELTISCGAALFNLEVTAAAAGFQPHVDVLPADESDVLARVRWQPGGGAEGWAEPLHRAIPRRHTTRQRFEPEPPPAAFEEALLDVAERHPVDVHLAIDRASIADLVEAGDRAQFGDRRWRRELAGWMRPRRGGDGLTVPPVLGAVTRVGIRLADLGASVARADRAFAIDAPVVAVVSTDGDEPATWVATGRALQHLLLAAADLGVGAGYLNQPCQVPALRAQLQPRVDGAYPQLVVRFGRVSPPKRPSPRRPTAELTTVAGP